MSNRDINSTKKWSRDMWMKSADRYDKMIRQLHQSPEFLGILSSLADPSSMDELARTLVRVSPDPLFLVYCLTKEEFKNSESDPGAILRSNSLATKVQTMLARTHGKQYVRQVLGSFLTRVISDESLSFEMDPGKIRTGEEPAIAVARSSILLSNAVQEVVCIISSKSAMNQLPIVMKKIAGIVIALAEEVGLEKDQRLQLVGGFIMLRFICPAILTPDVMNAVSFEISISPKARRNLVLMAKVLQNMANNIEFGVKEPFMVPLNAVFHKNKDTMKEYLESVYIKPDSMPPVLDKKAWDEFDVRSRFHTDLVYLHYVFGPVVSKYMKSPNSGGSWDLAQFCHFVTELGPCPPFSNSSKITSNFDIPSYDSDRTLSPITGEELSSEKTELFHLLNESRFFYRGPNARKGEAVFYLILSKLPIKVLEDLSVIPEYIVGIAENGLNGPYMIIFDMSWSNFSSDIQRKIFRSAGSVTKYFTHEQRKNLATVFILHPSTFTRTAYLVIRPFTSRKLANKIVNIHDWKDLKPFVADTNLAIPEESKDFFAKSYKVVKVNAKGKRQERVIKFTTTSLLNIDPSSRRVRNERELKEVVEVSIEKNNPTLDMRFDEELLKGKGIRSFFADDEDKKRRHYEFSSMEDRDNVIEDMFYTGFMYGIMPSSFDVVKVNEVGKHQNRHIKFTRDSFLNCKESGKGTWEIKREISYAGIERVEDESDVKGDRGTVWYLCKTDKLPRALITPNFKELYKAMLDGMKKYSSLAATQDQTVSASMAAMNVQKQSGPASTAHPVSRLRGMTLGLPRPSDDEASVRSTRSIRGGDEFRKSATIINTNFALPPPPKRDPPAVSAPPSRKAPAQPHVAPPDRKAPPQPYELPPDRSAPPTPPIQEQPRRRGKMNREVFYDPPKPDTSVTKTEPSVQKPPTAIDRIPDPIAENPETVKDERSSKPTLPDERVDSARIKSVERSIENAEKEALLQLDNLLSM